MLGNAGLYSVNYDRVFVIIAERHRVGARLGFSLMPIDTLNTRLPLVFPFTVNYLYGAQRRLEIGAGIAARIVFNSGWDPAASVHFAATLGYRLQRFDNDFVFRIGFTPLFYGRFLPWIGLSLGRAF